MWNRKAQGHSWSQIGSRLVLLLTLLMLTGCAKFQMPVASAQASAASPALAEAPQHSSNPEAQANFEQGMVLMRHLEGVPPESIYWQAELGKDVTSAFQFFTLAIKQDPNFAAPYVQRAETKRYMALFWPQASVLSDYDKAIQLQEGYAAAYLGRGKLLCEAGQIEAGFVDLDKAVTLQPDFENLVTRAKFYVENEKPDEALADFAKAETLMKAEVSSYQVFNFYAFRGFALLAQRKPIEAVASLSQALALTPNLNHFVLATLSDRLPYLNTQLNRLKPGTVPYTQLAALIVQIDKAPGGAWDPYK